jgi:hypothetical protein
MTGAIGAGRTAVSTALAGLNGKRLAAHAAARPKVKRLRVESSGMKMICHPYPASLQIGGECGI